MVLERKRTLEESVLGVYSIWYICRHYMSFPLFLLPKKKSPPIEKIPPSGNHGGKNSFKSLTYPFDGWTMHGHIVDVLNRDIGPLSYGGNN